MNTETLKLLQIATNQFDYYEIVKILENVTIIDKNDKDCGLWQENFTIIPNIKRVNEIIQPSKPISIGKYWMVFNNADISVNMQTILEEEDYWLIDYITQEDFINWGIK